MNSNLILVSPFITITLTIRHWNSPAAVIWMYADPHGHELGVKGWVAQAKIAPTHITEKPACDPHRHELGVKGWVAQCQNCPHPQLKSQLVGEATFKRLNQLKLTQSWCKRRNQLQLLIV
eukprot:scaffold48013_cov78-Cyclotella_meneghiniana.AAC.2